jgi:nitrous oxide reductase accessory protein NosL
MKNIKLLLLAIGIILGLSACEREISTELKEVHWDRDMCERCKMVVSDRKHAVQVIDAQSGRSYMFDDIGCVVLWFDDAQIAWSKEAKIWITDIISGKWIDARTAFYDTNNITPMGNGF